ncbi:sulfate transporter family protein [Lichenihabitans sp. Uapishka_5]|uniref:sulfate transporter family protein n=1 Tax=Lichenihabitans sp. Uapishka_5 TaxID=3037302 RepID=UPI0029E823B1|nr:sulfate transporter family protein [Lichenihabitans sp. Uapishka_5]MDX7952708.1 sulfate transporter family protein [Lichenihabitans sp. Uapishka_5]
MFADAAAAFSEIFTPAFRTVFWKVLGVTLAILAVLVVGLHHGLLSLLTLPYPWLQALASLLASLGLLVGSVFLVAPVSAIVAGFFVDDLAERVERDVDPAGVPGRPISIGASVWLGIRFGVVSLGVTLLAIGLLFVPGINAVAFLAANTYLFGRQYFEFAALRFHDYGQAAALRQRHGLLVFSAGFLIAVFVSVPVLNLLTPLFGTALMVRVHKRIMRRALPPPR